MIEDRQRPEHSCIDLLKFLWIAAAFHACLKVRQWSPSVQTCSPRGYKQRRREGVCIVSSQFGQLLVVPVQLPLIFTLICNIM